MIDYTDLLQTLAEVPALEAWAKALPGQIEQALAPGCHGEMGTWQAALAAQPDIQASRYDLDQGCVQIGDAADCDEATRRQLEQCLKQYHPWRKGPFSLFGIAIDTEWHSDWKWARLAPHISPLRDRLVLDVGCGNGYYLLRMLGQGARLALGIDPSLRYVMQFQALKRYLPGIAAHVLPLGIEALPGRLRAFDTVFSMGVLYHRRSPLDHLYELRDCLRPGGELVLETLVIEGDEGQVLLPRDRYAMMRNVWFIPSCPTLKAWLERCGFTDVRFADVSPTRVEEQRTTEWMTYQSLADFLDPNDPGLTAEGYPAPVRATVIARSPA